MSFSWFLLFQSYFSRGGAPFIGMIVSPYDPANPSPHSQTTCLLVKVNQEPSGSQSKFNIPTPSGSHQFYNLRVWISHLSVGFLTQSFSLFFPRAALQIWFQVITRHSRLGPDDEESSVDNPQIQPISSVSAKGVLKRLQHCQSWPNESHLNITKVVFNFLFLPQDICAKQTICMFSLL